MLVLTDNATTVIHTLVDRPELPDTAGLRITSTYDGSERLSIAAVETPEVGDQIVEQEGARVFLEPSAAAVLEHQVLDANVDGQGSVQFVLVSQ